METLSFVPRNAPSPSSLQRAQAQLQRAKQFLCAGCKRDCERRLTQFGGSCQ